MSAPQQQRKLTGALSPSFRLRNSSLNVIRLRRIFDLFDRDSDGLITPSELSDALNRLGLQSDPTDVSSLLFPSGGDSPGLDFPAFEALHRSLGDALHIGASEGDGGPHKEEEEQQEEEEDMAEAFRVFDEDGDGFISAEELQAVLRKLGMEEEAWRSLDKVRVMIGSADCNEDGRVDFYEFKNMMRRAVVVVEG